MQPRAHIARVTHARTQPQRSHVKFGVQAVAEYILQALSLDMLRQQTRSGTTPPTARLAAHSSSSCQESFITTALSNIRQLAHKVACCPTYLSGLSSLPQNKSLAALVRNMYLLQHRTSCMATDRRTDILGMYRWYVQWWIGPKGKGGEAGDGAHFGAEPGS
jgi:hypothetical protein